MEKISKYLSLEQAIFSVTAKNKKIDNTPPKNLVKNIELTSLNIYDKLEDVFPSMLSINSFYRSDALNKAIGGSTTSDHSIGCAIDIATNAMGRKNLLSNVKIGEFAIDNLDFDQIIFEYPNKQTKDVGWIHISYRGDGIVGAKTKNRRMILIAEKGVNGKVVYLVYSKNELVKRLK
jgi:hypothetical protein